MATWLEMSRSPEYSPAILSRELRKVHYLVGIDEFDEALAGETIILGGYLNTQLIAAKSIFAKHLDVDSLSAISANLGTITGGSLNIGNGAFKVSSAGKLEATGADISGRMTANNVTINENGLTVDNGALIIRDGSNSAIITSQGLRTVYVYGSNGAWCGWDKMGLNDYDLQSYNSSVIVYVPDNFTITKATLITKVMPCYRTNDPRGAPNGYYFPRQLRLYTANLTSGVIWVDGYTIYETPEYQTRDDLTTTIWGGEWTPTGTTMRTKTANISSVLTAGHNVLLVRTGIANTVDNLRYFGLVRMDVVVEGFLRG